MGRAANVGKARTCRACKSSVHGPAEALREHSRTCARMMALGLVAPGLVVGQDAVDALNRAGDIARRRGKPRWS